MSFADDPITRGFEILLEFVEADLDHRKPKKVFRRWAWLDDRKPLPHVPPCMCERCNPREFFPQPVDLKMG